MLVLADCEAATSLLESDQEFSLESSQESSSEESELSLASQAAWDISVLNPDQPAYQNPEIPISKLNQDQSADQKPELPVTTDSACCDSDNELESRQEYQSPSIRSVENKTIISIPSRPAPVSETLAIKLRELLDQPAGYDINIWSTDLESLTRRHNSEFISYVWDWAYQTGPPATVKFWQGRTFNAKNAVKHFESQADQMEKAQAAAKKRASRVNHAESAIPGGIKL